MTGKMTRQSHRIIVEGMDGAGKTTLISQLSAEFPQLEVVIRPQGVPFDDWWPREMDRSILKPVPLYDRFFYSELVYGPIIRGKISADMNLVNNVAWFMRAVALLIYVRPHSEIIQTNVHTNPQMEGVINNFKELLGQYDQLMAAELQWYGPRFVHYDWNSTNAFPAVTSLVRRYLDGNP
jgi:GTPase SAR1 family protein